MAKLRNIVLALLLLVSTAYAQGPAGNDDGIIPANSIILRSMPDRGLVGYWSFDDSTGVTGVTALDLSGYGNDGAITGAVDTTGVVREGLFFSGSGDKIDTGADMIGTGADTFCAWINPASLGTSSAGRIIDNAGIVLATYVSNTLLFSSDDSTVITSPFNSITLNQWQHVCVTRDAAGLATFYINGVQSGTMNRNSGTPVAGANNVIIGNDLASARDFNGGMDEIRIYDRVLSPGEIKTLASQTNPKIHISPDNDVSATSITLIDGRGKVSINPSGGITAAGMIIQ